MDVSKIIVIVQKFDFILDNDAKANSVPKKTKVGVLYHRKCDIYYEMLKYN